MQQLSIKNLSLLGLVLMAASAVTAAVIPNKSNGKRVNNGSLRNFSFTDAGVDQDASQAVISCKALGSAASCTATGSVTTTGFFQNDSLVQISPFFYQTIGNTSQTGGPANGDQNSVLQVVG